MSSKGSSFSGLYKLSKRNARRQARDYAVYFVTMILAAALIYAFNGLVVSDSIKTLSGLLDYMTLMIVMSSIAVVFIIGWLCSYTMKFMLSKRSKEMGLYILMGMETRQVSMLFMLENIVVGIASLVAGVFLGGVIFQALNAILMNLYGLPYHFSYNLSIKAILLTILYFALIFAFALLKSRKQIRGTKIYDLIYSDKQNESQAVKKSKSRRKMFVCSLIFGVIGTLLLMTRNGGLGAIGAMFLIAFYFMFFMSFSSGVPVFFEKHPEKKYAKTNLVVFRSLASKMNTMGMTMATIAMLITGTLIAVGMGTLLMNLFSQNELLVTSYDLLMASDVADEDFGEYWEYIDENISVRDQHSYNIYYTGSDTIMRYIEDRTEYYRFDESDRDSYMAQSDYIYLRKMLDFPPVELSSDGYYIHCMEYLEKTMEAYDELIEIDGMSLGKTGISTESFSQFSWDSNGRGLTVIVPDSLVSNLNPVRKICAIMTDEPVDGALFEDLASIQDKRTHRVENDGSVFYNYAERIVSLGAEIEDNASLYALVVFPLFYLALVLIMTAVTILTTQLLSDGPKYKRQFELLDNLGMSRRDMTQAVRRQFAAFYTMPVVMPCVICMFFMASLGKTFDPGIIASSAHLWSMIGITLGLFLAIYLIYVAVAYVSFKRAVLAE